jgi:hypothetical protein
MPAAKGAQRGEDAVLDERTTPAQAVALLRAAQGLDAAARHDHAVAGNSRGHRLYQAGKCPEALPLFEAAAALDRAYGMPRYSAARCHALAGDAPAATRWLGELKSAGKAQRQRLQQAKKDEAFKKIAADPAFQALFD